MTSCPMVLAAPQGRRAESSRRLRVAAARRTGDLLTDFLPVRGGVSLDEACRKNYARYHYTGFLYPKLLPKLSAGSGQA